MPIGQEIRALDYLSWKDPWAWMENMKGKQWETLLKQEKANYNELSKQVERQARHMEKELEEAQREYYHEGFTLLCGNIQVMNMNGMKWKWAWDKEWKDTKAIDALGRNAFIVVSDTKNNYKNILECYDIYNKVIWKKENISSQFAVVNNLCYYITVENLFIPKDIRVCDALTGKNERIIYTNKDQSKDLIFIKGANRTLYLKVDNVSNSDSYIINGISLEQIDKHSLIQVPLGKIENKNCRLIKKAFGEKWEAKGCDWQLPKGVEPLWANINTGHLLTIKEGQYSIWHCMSKKQPIQVFSLRAGEIVALEANRWESSISQKFYITTPFELPYAIILIHNKIVYKSQREQKKEFPPLEVHTFNATSHGTKIPYIVVKEKGKRIKAQLIYVYGAYESPTGVKWPYSQWYPLLKRGWAIVYALVRGGGDNGFEWANCVRRENRHISVDDFDAVIRASQKKLHLSPEKTVIYGRSAGGLPVGAIVGRYPDGELVGAAYAEMPYVDVLRTSTNPTLPLTIGEYHEFGNPIKRIQNFREMLNVSPINILEPGGAPGVFVLTKTGLLDKQVFAYEPFKWVQKLRGYSSLENSDIKNPKGKYITFDKSEGHHYSSKKNVPARALDLALLDAWVEKNLRY
jgi:hypothetical protein